MKITHLKLAMPYHDHWNSSFKKLVIYEAYHYDKVSDKLYCLTSHNKKYLAYHTKRGNDILVGNFLNNDMNSLMDIQSEFSEDELIHLLDIFFVDKELFRTMVLHKIFNI